MRNRKVWIALGVLVVVGLVGGIIGVTVLRSGSEDDPKVTARAYLDAWRRTDVVALGRLTTGPVADVRATYRAQARDLGGSPSTVELLRVVHTGEKATAKYAATFSFGPGRTWSYRGELPMQHSSDGWKVEWSPTNVYPGLQSDQHFNLTRAFAPRAPILAEDGTPLTVDGSVVTVGIEPQRIDSREAVTAVLQENLGVDPALVNQKLDAPGVQPDYFVPIVTVPEATYQAVKPKIYDVHGLLFRRSTERQAATAQLGAHVVGTVGPITKEILDELGEPYRDTDQVGRSGLERKYERRLAGTPSLTIELVDSTGKANPITTLPGADPQPVRTTLDLPTQMRAEAAVGTTGPAALVATRPSDGAVRAVVSTPVTEGFDRALDGAYPPGSTFKVVTTAALLANGTTPDTPTTCPPSVDVNGRDFVNFEGETEPTLTFRRAFAISCNTAFIGLAQKLPADALATAARWFGFGATPDLGLAAKGGELPDPRRGDRAGRVGHRPGPGHREPARDGGSGGHGRRRCLARSVPRGRAGAHRQPAPGNAARPCPGGRPLVAHARGRPERDGNRGRGRRSGHRRQDRDGRVRHRHTPEDPRLVHRLPRRPRVRGDRRRWRRRRPRRRADRPRLPRGRLRGPDAVHCTRPTPFRWSEGARTSTRGRKSRGARERDETVTVASEHRGDLDDEAACGAQGITALGVAMAPGDPRVPAVAVVLEGDDGRSGIGRGRHGARPEACGPETGERVPAGRRRSGLSPPGPPNRCPCRRRPARSGTARSRSPAHLDRPVAPPATAAGPR